MIYIQEVMTIIYVITAIRA